MITHMNMHIMYRYSELLGTPTTRVAPRAQGDVWFPTEGSLASLTRQEGTGSVRFVSVPDFSTINWFGSVRFGQIFVPVRRGSAAFFERVVARSGSVRFVSASSSGRFRNSTVRFGSVRFSRFGSVSYSFLIRRSSEERDDRQLLVS